MKLTLEQEFQLRVYRQQLMKLNQTQVQKHLIDVLKQMMLKYNFIKYLLRKAT
jgi:hypothetical protein